MDSWRILPKSYKTVSVKNSIRVPVDWFQSCNIDISGKNLHILFSALPKTVPQKVQF